MERDVILCVFCLLSLFTFEAHGRSVTKVEPRYGGLGGAVLLTIHGTGFSPDPFSFGSGNENNGNNAILKSETRSYPCSTHPNGNTEKSFNCFTPKDMEPDDYWVEVSIDGEKIPEGDQCKTCYFTPETKSTPTIGNIEPKTGLPGTVIEVKGTIFTTRYGSNLPASANGIDAKILRVYLGGSDCAMKMPDSDDFYGLGLDSQVNADGVEEYLNTGFFKCKAEKSNYVGNQRLTYILDQKYGRNVPDISQMKFFTPGQVGMFQTYAEVSDISPAVGSTSGGTLLTISGNFFDKTDSPVAVYIGGVKAEAELKNLTEIVVKTPAKPANMRTTYPGNRGVLLETWPDSVQYADLSSYAYNTAAAGYASSVKGSTMYSDDASNAAAVVRMSGFFSPPIDGDYEFLLSSQGGARLFVSTTEDPANKTEVVACASCNNKVSSVTQLAKGSIYYFEILHSRADNTSSVKMAARVYNATKLASETGDVTQERQRVTFSSQVKTEQQDVTFAAGSASYSAPQQKVVVTITGGSFKLCLLEVCTEWMSDSLGALDIQKYLNALPIFTGKFAVAGSIATTTGTWTVTIDTDAGNVPLMKSQTKDGTSVSVSNVVTGTTGTAHFSLNFDGKIVGPIDAAGSVASVQAAFDEAIGVRCPSNLYNHRAAVYVNNFEASGDNKNLWGAVVYDKEPFCGKGSVKNVGNLYYNVLKPTIPIDNLLQVCFAYMGNMTDTITTLCADSTGEDRWRSTSSGFDPLVTSWQYKCFKATDLFHSSCAKMKRIYLQWKKRDFWVDAVTIMQGRPTTDEESADIVKQRYPAARFGGQVVRTVTVTDTGSARRVDISPYECGFNGPKISAWGSAGATVVQNQAASPPIQGSVTLTYDGASVEFSANSHVDDVRRLMNSMNKFKDVLVTRSGDCANYRWDIEWTKDTGNLPEMTVNTAKLTSNNNPNAVVSTIQHGHTLLNPVLDDTLTTPHADPQVQVVINGIMSSCKDGSSCKFEWSSSVTPTITAISPTSGTQALSTELTITGTNFASVSSDNKVTIAGVNCAVSTSTSTEIKCNVGNGPIGAFDVMVEVSGKGMASGSRQFSYTAGLNGISPSSGSMGGGTSLTITGYGLSLAATVTVDGNPCTIQGKVLPGQIICLTPAGTSGAKPIVVSDQGSTLTGQSFTYDAGMTASITSLSGSTFGVFGTETLTITGTGFTSTQGTVSLGGTAATVTSWSDTQVVATVPAKAPGTYPVQVAVGTNGFAKYGAGVTDITIKLKVTAMSPSKGSVYGGTSVTLVGEGFGTDKTLAKVKLGPYTCGVESITATKIVCLVAETGSTVDVTPDGESAVYGAGYQWDPVSVSVQVGDTIRWSWNSPVTQYGIQQVDPNDPNVNITGGFATQQQSYKGVYSYQFNKVGQYSYSSNAIKTSSQDIYIIGQVNVAEKQQSVQDLSLVVNGFDALQDVNSGVSVPAASGCGEDTSDLSGCSVTPPTGGAADKFSFAFQTCSSGTVTSFSTNDASNLDTITVTGSGFSSSACQNEIYFGDYSCLASSASASQVSCTLDPAGTMQPNQGQAIRVRHANRGYMILDINDPRKRFFVMRSSVSSVTPTEGSVMGGAALTIEGSGFVNAMVTVGGKTCLDIVQTYTQITCKSPSSTSVASKEVRVTVGGSPAECAAGVCFHYYRELWRVLTVSPDSLDGSSSVTMTLTGTGFGTTSSDVSVDVGGSTCTIATITDTQITCTIQYAPAGVNPVNVLRQPYGKMKSDASVEGVLKITSVSPSTVGEFGGAVLTVSGNGFKDGNTDVKVGGVACTIIQVNMNEVTCKIPAHSGPISGRKKRSTSDQPIVVTIGSNTVTSTTSLTYDTALTPTITSVNPTSGYAGQTLTIAGSGFSNTAGDITVTIDDANCAVTSASTSEVQCTLGSHTAANNLAVLVSVANAGVSDGSTTFSYTFVVSSLNPTTGSMGGGQTLVINGQGLDSAASIEICGQPCPLDGSASQTSSALTCITPAENTGATGTKACTLTVTMGTVTDSSQSYTYDDSLTPQVTGVAPAMGGTGGGTTITITGSGFGNTAGDISVSIEGIACTSVTITNADTQITCVTGQSSKTVQSSVDVRVGSGGVAKKVSADFRYIDVWSSVYTWGGTALPAADSLVIINAGQTILYDMDDSPIYSMVLIRGGSLIFSDAKDTKLNTKYILITDDGLLQIGTSSQRHQHNANIVIHGVFRSPELPIYGAKSIAIRNGTLDLHGKQQDVTWSRLASTADAGSSQIVLQDEVAWPVGAKIVLATTGHRHTQSETEVRTIQSIAGDKKTITLSSPLTYKHVGISETYGSRTVEMRGEVGLLSHNIRIEGSRDVQFNDQIEACPDGFDTGEFTTQTCFQGRFGDEMGSDQFGVTIMFHNPTKDSNAVRGYLENVEITHAGQAFRLGRYPVHFHLNGDMTGSYVRGCAIYSTFNRAINVHGIQGILAERTVAYNIMGGSLFFEDGVEYGNTFRYNLVIFAKASSSLLNDDITPASIWITNPNNTVEHNAAAGGTHFGYWFRMHEHPDGPSFDASIYPQNVPLGSFKGNTAHSFGWFGLWIFQEYHPRTGGTPNGDFAPAVFEDFVAWNCEKGAEAVNVGATIYDNFVGVNNEKAGFEGKKVLASPQFNDTSSYMVRNSLFVARSTQLDLQPQWGGSEGTVGGIVLPYGSGMIVSNVDFYNFNAANSHAFTYTKIDGTCKIFCGGYTYHTKGLSFTNSPNKVKYDWTHQAVMRDLDGTLTGSSGTQVIPTVGSLPSSCSSASSGFNSPTPASFCPGSLRFHRFAFNKVHPSSLMFKDVRMTNQYGAATAPYALKRLSHPEGWMQILPGGGEKYYMDFVNGETITNISYTAGFYSFSESTDCIQICSKLDKQPDRFFWGNLAPINMTNGPLDCNNVENGDWYYDNSTKDMCFVVHAQTRAKRGGGMAHYDYDRLGDLTAYKCYYDSCIAPDPLKIPPDCSRPSNSSTWSTFDWSTVPESLCMTYANGACQAPTDGDSVKIPAGYWMVLDANTPQLKHLIIEGTLEVLNAASTDVTISAEIIYIQAGQLIIGCDENSQFLGKATINLLGGSTSDKWTTVNGPELGNKAIGVYGGLMLNGKDVGKTWTNLAVTAEAGSNTITLKEEVGWAVGDEIVISATSINIHQYETRTIAAKSNSNGQTTLTLNSPLSHKHIVVSETLPSGANYTLAGEVGLLTRNIRIVGAPYANQEQEAYGGRVLVAVTKIGSESYGGYARISNVEFYRCGQEGFNEFYDPRFQIAYSSVGDTKVIARPSSVKKCSFNRGFSTAVGAFGADNLVIDQNVIFETVRTAIHTTSKATEITNNLLVLNWYPGAYNGRTESTNTKYDGSITALASTSLRFEGNSISSAERAAFHGTPEDCTGSTYPWANNVFHSSLVGTVLFTKDSEVDMTPRCWRYSGITIYRVVDFGIYYVKEMSLTVENVKLIDNGIGTHVFVVGPDILTHEPDLDRHFTFKNSLVVGKSSGFDCSADKYTETNMNYYLYAGHGRSYRYRNGAVGTSLSTAGGTAGVLFGTFTSGTNNADAKPLVNIMAYNAYAGKTILTGNTFANFGATCNGEYDFALSTHPKNDDLIHPTYISATTLHNVDNNAKTFFSKPNVGKINPSDCVDMDCDGFKKVMVKDTDGTFLGQTGTLLSNSAYEWDGDPRHGLGDYRIPKAMQTYPDNTRIPFNVLAEGKGILRDDTCTWNAIWNAWLCNQFTYDMLVIENMDQDTETRRLSPVALLGWDDNDKGYIDLINGPQDHGWCAGYTCQKRVSTFHAIVADKRNFTMYFTSTSPQHLRFRILNAPNTKVMVGTYYHFPNRLDVYVDDQYVAPKNGQFDSNNNLVLTAPDPSTPRQYYPDVNSDACGANFLDRDWQQMNVVICGGKKTEIIVNEVIVVGFNVPTLTVDQFFGENLVNNLATFLGISPHNIRQVDIKSGVSRRKRSTGSNTYVVMEIGDSPCQTASCTGNTLTFDAASLSEAASKVINSYQLGNLSDILNITINNMKVSEAIPPVTDPNWATVLSSGTFDATLRIPSDMIAHTTISPGTEGNAFPTQPKFKFHDASGTHVTLLGASAHPWKIKAVLRAGSGDNAMATLIGNDTVEFKDGWANFTTLGISHAGNGFVVDFSIIYPDDSPFTLASVPLKINERNIKAVVTRTSGDVYAGSQHSIQVQLYDSDTNIAIPDIAWSGLTWAVNITEATGTGYTGSSSGTMYGVMNPVTGLLTINDLRLTQPGTQAFDILVTPSSGPKTYRAKVLLISHRPDLQSMQIDMANTLAVKVDASYDTYGNEEFASAYLNHLYGKDITVKYSNVAVSRGSVVITTTVSGNSTTVTQMVDSVCSDITSSTTFTYNGQTFTLSSYMMLNGNQYYGNGCGTEEEKKDDDKKDATKLALIIGLVVAVIVIIILTGFLLYWKCVVLPKTKTHKIYSWKEIENKHLGTHLGGEDILWREDSFMSIRQNYLPDRPMPGMNTAMHMNHMAPPYSEKPPLTPPPSYHRGTATPPRVVTPSGSTRTGTPPGSESSHRRTMVSSHM